MTSDLCAIWAGILDAYESRCETHPIEGEHEGLPHPAWAGWRAMVEDLALIVDNPEFRVRKATKIALQANENNLLSGDVDWLAVEAELVAICMGEVPVMAMPTTQQDIERVAATAAYINAQERKRRQGRSDLHYMVVFPGQSQELGNWYSRGELKKDFPETWQTMLKEWKADKRTRSDSAAVQDFLLGNTGLATAQLIQEEVQILRQDPQGSAIHGKLDMPPVTGGTDMQLPAPAGIYRAPSPPVLAVPHGVPMNQQFIDPAHELLQLKPVPAPANGVQHLFDPNLGWQQQQVVGSSSWSPVSAQVAAAPEPQMNRAPHPRPMSFVDVMSLAAPRNAPGNMHLEMAPGASAPIGAPPAARCHPLIAANLEFAGVSGGWDQNLQAPRALAGIPQSVQPNQPSFSPPMHLQQVQKSSPKPQSLELEQQQDLPIDVQSEQPSARKQQHQEILPGPARDSRSAGVPPEHSAAPTQLEPLPQKDDSGPAEEDGEANARKCQKRVAASVVDVSSVEATQRVGSEIRGFSDLAPRKRGSRRMVQGRQSRLHKEGSRGVASYDKKKASESVREGSVIAPTEDGQEVNKDDREWRLSEVGWEGAKITGAKNRDDNIIDVWIVWKDGHELIIPSSELLGHRRVHCMEALIQFYESKTKKPKQAPKNAS